MAAVAADPLVIREIEFLGGMARAGGWRPTPGLPEVAFAGRSNVGKSSLLNRLVRRRALARVSRTPGRTREINFFALNGQMVFADLPGYGYARASETDRRAFRALVDAYLASSPELRGVVLLLDVRREPTPDDLVMIERLADLGLPALYAITKMDKLTAAAGRARAEAITKTLSAEDDQVVPFSARTGLGRDELASAIVDLVATPSRTA